MATSSAAFKTFRSTGVLVFANSKRDWSSMPKGAQASARTAGNIIPKVLVTTADGKTNLAGISYDTLKADIRDARRDLETKLESVDVLGGPSEKEEPKEPMTEEKKSGLLAESQAWTNSEGKTITAAVKSFDGADVIFLMNGREVPYSISKLSAESQEKIKALSK